MKEVLRVEQKYLISHIDKIKLSTQLVRFLMTDTHNVNGFYRVRSLYFDTINDCDYWDKINGIELRKKIRLRFYSDSDDFAFLEVKQKQGVYQRKRSLSINKEDAKKLARGNYSVLLKYTDDFAIECYYLLTSGLYLPKSVVEYKRAAFTSNIANTRVTLDYDVKSCNTNFDIFEKNLPLVPILHDSICILEVKFNGFLTSNIQHILDSVNCSSTSASKYCLGRGAN